MSPKDKLICRGCVSVIKGAPSVRLGNSAWHVTCFKCAKCHNDIESQTNILLLSDDSPLCPDCSQECHFCRLPISDEAVLTADQCYHATCFKCAKCSNKIEGSLFARTSNGTHCMSCYALRREAKKKGANLSQVQAGDPSRELSDNQLPNSDCLTPFDDESTISPLTLKSDSKKLDESQFFPGRHDYSSSADFKNHPSLIAKPLQEGKEGCFHSRSSKEWNQMQLYIDNLHNNMQSLQKRLKACEFENSKYKLLNLQAKDKIVSTQTELIKETKRRQKAEMMLIQLESEHKLKNSSISELSKHISELNNKQQLLANQVAELDSKRNHVEKEVTELDCKRELLKKEVTELDIERKLLKRDVTELDAKREHFEKELTKPQERSSSIKEVILVKEEMKSLMKDIQASKQSIDIANSPISPMPPALARCYNSNENLFNPDHKLNRRKCSLPALDELSTLMSTAVPVQRRFRLNQAKRLPSPCLESVVKPRPNLARRSLDIRPLDERCLSYKFDKRGSVDHSSSGLDSPGLDDDFSAPSSQSDTFSLPNTPTILSDRPSNDRDFKVNGNKKFKWKNAFKMVPKPTGYLNDNSPLKGLILSPKCPPSLDQEPLVISEPLLFTSPEMPCFPSEAEMQYRQTSLTLNPELNESRAHMLIPHSYLRPVKCDCCKEKMWGLQAKALRCSDCGLHCHLKCAELASDDCTGIWKESRRPSQPFALNISSPLDIPNNYGNALLENGPQTTMLPFGMELKLQMEREAAEASVPEIVRQCVEIVDDKGLHTEGIYRVSGPHSVIKSLRRQLNSVTKLDQNEIDHFRDFKDVTAITSVLKQYFRELPTPLFTYNYYDDWIQATNLTESSERILAYTNIVKELPKVYRTTLIYFMDHLNRVYQNQETNLMTSKNLGVVFGPTLIRSRDDSQDLEDMVIKNTTIDFLIQAWDTIQPSLTNL